MRTHGVALGESPRAALPVGAPPPLRDKPSLAVLPFQKTIALSLQTLAVGEHISLIGASLSASGAGLDPLLLTGRGITLAWISVGSRTDFEAMNRAIALHRLRPVIDRTFPFREVKEAYRHFEGRSHFGKVAITHG